MARIELILRMKTYLGGLCHDLCGVVRFFGYWQYLYYGFGRNVDCIILHSIGYGSDH